MTRTFKELALCHLPDSEIQWLQDTLTDPADWTAAYKGHFGFFIWTGYHRSPLCPPVLQEILQLEVSFVDYVLFDTDVEPSPNLEVFEC